MRQLRKLFSRLTTLFRPDRLDRDLHDEVAFHLEMRVREKTELGMDPEQARLEARREFGPPLAVKEACRDVRLFAWIESVAQDVRVGFRSLTQTKGLTAIAVATLALGIGANTTMFSAFNALRLQPLPFRDPSELVTISESNPQKGVHRRSPKFSTVVAILKNTDLFEDIGLVGGSEIRTISGTGETERVVSQTIDVNALRVLGAEAMVGRIFQPGDAIAGKGTLCPVVLSYGTWQTRFGGMRNVVGKTLRADGINRRILGVMPPGFWITPWNPDVAFWVCYDTSHNPQSRWMDKVARLKPGVTPEYAEAALTPLVRNVEADGGGDIDGLSADVERLRAAYMGNVEASLYFLSGAVTLVLLIACTNLAGLLTARGLGRRRELTVRASLGAGRGRLVRQLLIETLILALIGGVAALFVAFWGARLFSALAPDWFPGANDIVIDLNVLTFVFAVSLAAGLLFGAIPAWRTSSINLQQSLQEGGRNSPTASVGRSRGFLLATEVALAMILLVGVSFMVRGFARELYSDPGFRTNDVIQVDVALGPKTYWNNVATEKGFVFRAAPRVTPYFRRLLDRTRAIAGVERAAIATFLPQHAPEILSFSILGRPAAAEGEEPRTACIEVDSNLFQLLEVPVLRGRGISEQDTESAPWIAVVNETLANRHFPSGDPLGKDIRLTLGKTTANETIREPQSRRIVGVVADVRKPFNFNGPPAAEIYTSYQQYAPEYPGGGILQIHTSKKLLIRSSVDAASLTSPLRHAAAEIDPDQALSNIRTIQNALESPLAGHRFIVQLVSIFAVLALVLAAVGIYGVSSYTVNARWREFGIRRALGAQKGDLRRLSLGRVLRPALFGMAMGLGGVFALQKVLAAMPFGFRSNEIGTFVIASLVMLAVVLAAGYLPARRATQVNPLSVLRYE